MRKYFVSFFIRIHPEQRRDFVDQAISPIASTSDVLQGRANDSLFSTLYSELHRLARRQLARQWSPVGIGVTTLLHEAYLNIVDRNQPSFPDQARFMIWQ